MKYIYKNKIKRKQDFIVNIAYLNILLFRLIYSLLLESFSFILINYFRNFCMIFV